jgi:hypothetical protein
MGGKKKLKFKTKNEKKIMGKLLLICLFLKMKNEEISIMSFFFKIIIIIILKFSSFC